MPSDAEDGVHRTLTFGTPTGTELQSSNDLFSPCWPCRVHRRGAKVRDIGYGVRSDLELKFGRPFPSFGRPDADARNAPPS